MVQERRRAGIGGSKSCRSKCPKYYKIACARCGKEVIAQFPPAEGKERICPECFKK